MKSKAKVEKIITSLVLTLVLLTGGLFLPESGAGSFWPGASKSLAYSGMNSGDIVSIAGGYDQSLVVKNDGTVWSLGGTNDDGSGTPVQVSGLSGITAVSCGYVHSLALRSDGTVWTWGENGSGQLGDGSTIDRNTPMQVSGLNGITAVACGNVHCLVLKSDGTVWAWGLNGYGQLGDGSTTDRSRPVQVSGLSEITAVSCGDGHSLALKSDGTVWAWGYNEYGQLGDGSTTNRSTPVQVQGLSDLITNIACGDLHSMVLKSNGLVQTWGYNCNGQLGDGTNTTRLSPVEVKNLSHEVGDIVSIAAGSSFSLALKSDGTLRAWGNNYYGQLGNGRNVNTVSPVTVTDLGGITAVASGFHHSLALRNDGTVYSWGYNDFGQLGVGESWHCNTPVQVKAPGGNGYFSNVMMPDGELPVIWNDWTPRLNIAVDKSWTITFSMEVDPNCVNIDYIYVATDENGSDKEGVNPDFFDGDDKKVRISSPDAGWQMGSDYYLFISKDVQSTSATGNKKLSNGIRMKFSIVTNNQSN